MSKTAALALLGFLVLGCSSAPAAASPPADASPEATPSTSLPPRPSDSGLLAPTVPPSDPPVVGEVPAAMLDAVRARLVAETGIDPSAIVVKVAEAVDWPDGSLGCPELGVMYTQAIVPGYRVVLVGDGREYDYRVTAKGGTIRRCERVGPIGT